MSFAPATRPGDQVIDCLCDHGVAPDGERCLTCNGTSRLIRRDFERTGRSDLQRFVEYDQKEGGLSLPTTKQSRATQEITPLNARVLLAGTPGSGKTTLAAGWAPDTTLILDTHRGTTLLEGEHYVEHVADWAAFTRTVDDLAAGGHAFKTVVIDLIDDVWRFCDIAHAGKNAVAASATEDFNRSAKSAEVVYQQTLGKLLATPLGVWMISHCDEVKDDKITRYRAKLDKKVQTWTLGVCQFGFLVETLSGRRTIHTVPSAKFEAKSRVTLPPRMDLDPRALYLAMDHGLKAEAAKPKPTPPAAPAASAETTDSAPQEALAA